MGGVSLRVQLQESLLYGMGWLLILKPFYKHMIKQFDQCVGPGMETGLLLVIMEVNQPLYLYLRQPPLKQTLNIQNIFRLYKILATEYE